MALLDKGLKQRMVGALVLIALAVIFLPMLFSREDELRQVAVDAPSMPQTPSPPRIEMEQTAVPEPQQLPDEPIPSEMTPPESQPVASLPGEEVAPVTPAEAPKEEIAKPIASPTPSVPSKAPEGRLDANGLPVSWSVQLASLSNRASAENLQKTLRSQGYNAYIRSADGMNRVFVGPVIERAEADRLRDQLSRQQKLNGFVVRFQPEKG
ncbi:cell division protein [Pseudomonas sp. PIC25]|uniref:SPOR domain-containing protein n=1 Tax=Pseudomonas sp. PIC25 TaxID=1958773 RepID=UPI000BABDF38|nr:SPOR domain-containing protein [Pseudomonas sp. PIC25]PAU51123.1 cell division protein [Pseudomonas sp. PIC25]